MFSCNIGITNVSVFERACEHVIHSTEELLLEGFVGVVKLLEYDRLSLVCVREGGNLEVRGASGDDGYGSWVTGWDEGN